MADASIPFAGQGTGYKLAVIVNCYNYEGFVGEAVRSVQSQRHPECELVVVDDGSTDNSWQVIEATGATAYRIENVGQIGACRFGLEKTTAPFVLFLDADDELKPGAIARIIDILDPDVAKLQFPLTVIDELGAVVSNARPRLRNFRDRKGLATRVLQTSVYESPPTSGNVFRRDIAALMPAAGTHSGVDGVILYAAPFFGDIVSLDQPLGIYRVHNRNKSGAGKGPTVDKIEYYMGMHRDRCNELREILKPLGLDGKLAAPERTYYFCDLQFNHAILSGRRVGLRNFLRLMHALWWEWIPLKKKIGLSAYHLSAAVCPNSIAKALLDFRYLSKHRAAGLFTNLLGTKARLRPEPNS